MGSKVTIAFEPEGRKVKVPYGVTVLKAAKEASVGIRSECGGRGSCGKCKIIIKESDATSKVTATEKKLLSKQEISSGYRLACQTRILMNALIMLPPESMLTSRKIQVLGFERRVKLQPALKKFHVQLSEPTLSDLKPDLERLLDALSKQVPNSQELETDYNLLKNLPSVLRGANWRATVTVWGDKKIISIEPGDTSNLCYGFAVDVGTSKIVGHLVDLTTGETVGAGSVENPQIMHGEDIITRITFATTKKANLEVLQTLAVDGINKVLHAACTEAKVNPRNVYETTVVGNTAMHHLLLGIQPKYLALSPFSPAIRKQLNVEAKELKIKTNPSGIVTFLPVIAGFVGADAVADILTTNIHESDELSLLIDIGTNTEILVGNKDDILCCSCASGPAFEGVHIKHGVKAITGAIEKARIRKTTSSKLQFEYETIDGAKPTGLCGSAMIDIVAEMFKHKIIDNQGRFIIKNDSKMLRKTGDEIEFVLVGCGETATGKDITVTQKDINEIQLAKAAIYSGCLILLTEKKLEEADLDRVFIAGAFGNHINLENAKITGLIPDIPIEKISFVGNTAVTGAKTVLKSISIREKFETILKKVRYLELATHKNFSREFVDALFIPHKNLDKFYSIKKVQA
jgi:uncharacterized 2Fe-2S/4Fe-4S cluster protein (DUF4445 family)